MLCIIRIDEIDDFGEEEITRVLPRPEWIRDKKSVLQEVLGEERLTVISEPSKDTQLKTTSYQYDDWDRYDSEEPQDFTACDKECGYCGRCPY